MSASNRNKARSIKDGIRGNSRSDMRRRENRKDTRELRQGYRGTGMNQYWRYYSSEGLLVVDIGGPPIVGA